jgi:hypothetical protein
MPTQRLPLLTVGPPLEVSGRAAAIRAVSNAQVRGHRAGFLPPGRHTPPGPPESARPFMTSTDVGGRMSACRQVLRARLCGPPSG